MPLTSRKVEQEVAFVPYHLVDKDGKAPMETPLETPGQFVCAKRKRGDDELEDLGFVYPKSDDIVNIPLILI